MNQFALFFLFSPIILVGCVEDDMQVNPNLGYAYFPTDIGRYTIYRADSIYHDQPLPSVEGIHDTSSYFIKEYIESEFLDAQDHVSQRIVRSKRFSESDPWVVSDIWFSKRNANNAERVEENRRFVKLGFPISPFSSWDGNALNDKDEWRHEYDSINASRQVGALEFLNTLRVDQRDFLTEVNDEFAYEIYAEDVGLVFRFYKELFTRPSYLNNRVADNIISGNEYTWEVLEYGVE